MTSFLNDPIAKNLIKDFDSVVIFKVKRPNRNFLGSSQRGVGVVAYMLQSNVKNTY